jgi:hypothetical protein
MSFATEIAKRSLTLAPLVTISLDSATLRFARQGCPVATSAGHYQDRITSLGPVTRELSDPQRGLNPQGFSLSLDNGDRALSAHDPEDWLNRSATYQVYANREVQTFFTGIISDFRFSHGGLDLSITDRGDQLLGEDAKWFTRLSPNDWPGLDPDHVDRPMPIILGYHDSVAAGFAGMVPCIRLSPLRYLVAGHACSTVHRVFVGGVLQTSGYTVDLEHAHDGGIGGYITVIDFTTAPEGEVTADVKGLTDDLTASGALVQNLAAQAELLRKEVFALGDSYADTGRTSAAIKYCLKHRIRGAAWFGEALAPRELLGQLLGSGGLFGGWTREGKWAVWALDAPLSTSGATALDGLRDLGPGGLTYGPDTEAQGNHLTLQYLQRAAAGGYLGQTVIQDAASQADLGRTYKKNYALACAADALSAWQVGQLHLARSARQFRASFTGPLHLAALELGEMITVTDPWGPDAGGDGWTARAFWPTAFTFDPASGHVSASCLDASRLVE